MCTQPVRALAYVNAQPPRHGVIKRTIGRSLARRRPPPLPCRRRRCCVLMLICCRACLLLLPIIIALFLLLLCACSRTYGASWRELGERHASCHILLFLLLQLRLLRLLRVLLRPAAAAAAAAAAVCFAAAVSVSTCCRRRRRCCCYCSCRLLSWIFQSQSSEGDNYSLQNEMGQPVVCFLLDL